MDYNPFIHIIKHFAGQPPRPLLYNDLAVVNTELQKVGYIAEYPSQLLEVIKYLSENDILLLEEDEETGGYTISVKEYYEKI